MLTADTITDDQIRALRDDATAELRRIDTRRDTWQKMFDLQHAAAQARVALGDKRARRGWSRAKARARCAEILNERTSKGLS